MNNSLNTLIESEFPQLEGLSYLNHAAVAPWPRRTAEAVSAFARENLERGAEHYPRWTAAQQRLREQMAELVNAPSADDIALLKNTSEALSAVAHGLDWQPGDNVVTSDQEFPSNRIVWESLAGYGVETRLAPLAYADTPEDALIAQCDHNTRLLSISSVQYGTGLRLDLDRLHVFCDSHDILFCVDAIQSVGARPLDIRAIGADFAMADGHKWMLGPEGVALFYCRSGLRDRLTLRQYGWHMVENAHDFDAPTWEPAASARRFECGSPNMLGIHALSASLSLLSEVGMGEIETRVLANARYLMDRIGTLPGFHLITPIEEHRHAGIVTFRHNTLDADTMYKRLREGGVICARRGGGIRFSPHFYTPRAQLDQALEVLAGLS